MRINKVFVVAGVAAVMLSVMAIPAFTASEKRGNVGSIYDFESATYDNSGTVVALSCSYLHRTKIPTGFQEKQSCTIDPNASLPDKASRSSFGPNIWGSDYMLVTTGEWVTATSWNQQSMPDGTINIVSYYDK